MADESFLIYVFYQKALTNVYYGGKLITYHLKEKYHE